MTPYAESLFAAEPRLHAIRRAAAALEPDDWRGWEDRVKAPLTRLIGWFAEPGQSPALCTSRAYEAAYRAMLDAWELRDEAEARDAA